MFAWILKIPGAKAVFEWLYRLWAGQKNPPGFD